MLNVACCVRVKFKRKLVGNRKPLIAMETNQGSSIQKRHMVKIRYKCCGRVIFSCVLAL